jgi:predicted metal-dependent hydrolase
LARPDVGHGREVPVEGEARRVIVMTAIADRRSSIDEDAAGTIVVSRAAGDTRSNGELLEAWLRRRARAAIEERVSVRAAEMDVRVARITIRDQRTRWGSASRSGTLSFSWRLIMAPPSVLDYVVVHELAHFRVTGHSRGFWRVVDAFVTDSAAARRWLRANQSDVRHALS